MWTLQKLVDVGEFGRAEFGKSVNFHDVVPWGYGVAWHAELRQIVCYPIPLNLLMRWGRRLYFWMTKGGGHDWLSYDDVVQIRQEAYSYGYTTRGESKHIEHIIQTIQAHPGDHNDVLVIHLQEALSDHARRHLKDCVKRRFPLPAVLVLEPGASLNCLQEQQMAESHSRAWDHGYQAGKKNAMRSMAFAEFVQSERARG